MNNPPSIYRCVRLPIVLGLVLFFAALCLVVYERAKAQGSAGVLAFSQSGYSVNEGANSAITLTRTGGTTNEVVAKVTISDVSTSATDYTPLIPGKIDLGFATSTTKPGNAVYKALVQPDGKILFVGLQSPSGMGAAGGDGLGRLNTDGTPDASFNPTVEVNEGDNLALQADGKMVVIGLLRINPGDPRTGIARLNSDGTTDSTFNPGTGFNDYAPGAMVIQADGKIIVGGLSPTYNGVSKPFLVRINSNGSVDSSFPTGSGPNEAVTALALQPDGKILVGGRFNQFSGTPTHSLVRLNSDGSLDPSFTPPSVVDDLAPSRITIQPDGKLLLGGFFYINSPSANLTPMMRLNADGTLDSSFVASFPGRLSITSIVLQPDGKVLVGGIVGSGVYFLNRTNTDGSKDTTFSPAINNSSNSGVYAIALQGDGKLIVGGQFPAFTTKYLYRLEGDMFITWPAGDAADKVLSFPTVDDSIVEPSESMNLSITPVQGGATTGSIPTAILTINDNDTQLTAVSGSGVFGGTATMTATLSSFSGPVSGRTISFKFNNNTVGSGVTDANGVATINGVSLTGVNAGLYQGSIIPSFAGDSTFGASTGAGTLTVSKAPATLTLTSSVNPSDFGQSVTFTATATSNVGTPAGSVAFKADGSLFNSGVALNASGGATASTSGLASGTRSITAELNSTNYIANPSSPVSQVVKVAPTVTIDDVVLDEGNSGVRPMLFTITLSATSNANITVNFSTSNGTATSPGDFLTSSGTAALPAGTLKATVAVNIVGDTNVEPDETLFVNLITAQNATIARTSGTGFIVSDDNGSGNPIDLPGFFVYRHYVDFLSRFPDGSGFQFWRNQITSCGSDVQCVEVRRIDVSASFFLSIEFQQSGYLVERFYKVAYADATGTSNFGPSHQFSVPKVRFNEFLPDTQRVLQGVVVLAPGWEQALESNKQAYALEFVQTTRFINAFAGSLTPDQFVDTLSQNAGNVLSASERTTVISLFGGAANSSNVTARAQAVRMVAEDPDLSNAEFNRAFVLAQYFGYLRRNPNDAPEATLDYTGYDFWLTKLNQFNGNYINAEMVKAFLSSIEYRQRFGP